MAVSLVKVITFTSVISPTTSSPVRSYLILILLRTPVAFVRLNWITPYDLSVETPSLWIRILSFLTTSSLYHLGVLLTILATIQRVFARGLHWLVDRESVVSSYPRTSQKRWHKLRRYISTLSRTQITLHVTRNVRCRLIPLLVYFSSHQVLYCA